MARLFASFEEANNLTELEHVNHVEVQEGPCSEEDCEKYTEIKEAVEEALDAQGEVQEQIQNSEEILESSPNSVSESDVQEAQECLISTLSRLGLSRQDLVAYRISNESYMSNEERLRQTVKQLKVAQETIRKSLKSAILTSYKLADRRFGISKEYFAADWVNIFGPVATIWRGLTNFSKTKIEHPGAMVGLLLNKWATGAEGLSLVTKIILTPDVITMSKMFIDRIRKKESTAFGKQVLNAKKCNIYNTLFNNYKKVNTSNIEPYKREFELFKALISTIKSEVCVPCKTRTMSTSEIHDMKLFKPDKAKTEMETAIKYFEAQNPEFAKFANEVSTYVAENIIEFISNNIELK